MYGMKKGGMKSGRSYGSKSGMPDKAGGCMGVPLPMKAATNVSVGQQKNVNFMSESGHSAPKLNNDKAHGFRP